MQPGQELPHPVTTKSPLHPSPAAAMCTPCGWPHPPLTIPPFLLMQSLSTQILFCAVHSMT